MRRLIAVAVGVLVTSVVGEAAAQTLPASTNPAQRVVYRGDKTPEVQMSGQLTCYNWATEQIGWDPEAATAQMERDHSQAMQQFQQAQGGMVRGAAAGALTGLAIGAIAGDAGTGAAIGAVAGGAGGGLRARRGRMSAQATFEAVLAEFNAYFKQWDRHWTACMIGNGFGVG